MTGPKLNEGSRVAGERSGTKASARYVRMSASKARVVLDLIRNQPVRKADEVLQFTEREAARVVRKVLASAVANAIHNDEQDADELFVVACYADEGPTLRRFKPRARGRATRIRKRTCHITVIVARMSDDRLAIEMARVEGGQSTAAAARRARVERSRQRAAARKQGGAVDEAVQPDEAIDADDSVSVDSVDEVEAIDEVEDQAADEVEDDAADDTEAEASTDDEEAGDDDSAEEKN